MTRSVIYLDNAATTWPKPEAVYRAVDAAMREHGANPGRGSYRMSVEAQRIVDETRQGICRLFNAPDPARVIFTLNCTDALCIALKGLIKAGDRVVTGPYEHNSVVRPLSSLRPGGTQVAVARSTKTFGIDLDHFRELCRDRVDYVVLSHVSNVTGSVSPVKEIAEMTHQRGGLLILDAAQSAGDLDIDMQALGVDVLAAPGHKGLYGPMGTGVLVLSAPLPVKPLREGGTGFKSENPEQPEEYPWRLEAGTLNLPGIAGLAAGVRFVESVGVSTIAEHEAKLARALAKELRKIDGVTVFCEPVPRTGVVSFRLETGDVALAGTILDEAFGIAVRTGLHCAPATHNAIGTFPEGTVRVSFGQFNTQDHVDALVAAIPPLKNASRS
ncbi:MAG TPA: aminotransferase class V-fold PLP-dependent enzyme [Candidatus Margulisiibacteriota bacterium]|nr:aminotransferase class V-fold PLP-dependent enzyme [Candidatus Margulisiibacteriota bacterium]